MSHAARSVPPAEERFLIARAIGLVLLVVALGSLAFQKIVTDPDVPFLFSEQGADWIRFREPLVPQALESQTLVSNFRIHFDVEEIPSEAVLSFRAMKQAAVWIDNQLFHEAKSSLNEWKHVNHVDLAPALSRGPHDLRRMPLLSHILSRGGILGFSLFHVLDGRPFKRTGSACSSSSMELRFFAIECMVSPAALWGYFPRNPRGLV